VIERIRFASRARTLAPAAFAQAWPGAVARAAVAPAELRPRRVVACTTLVEPTGAEPRHDGLALESFDDAAHLARYESWLTTSRGRSSVAPLHAVLDEPASPVVHAERRVVRGADWLEDRWRSGGTRWKHLAIAVRSPGLSPAELSARWAGHAGTVGGSATAPAIVIPDDVRGLAYAQDHPCPRAGGEWAYDALSEVWFDDVDRLRVRVEWFRANVPGDHDDGLFRRSWSLAATEDVVAD
jgi:hypothetical protein